MSPADEHSGLDFNDGIAIVAGVGIYLAFVFWLHVSLIGIPVI